MHTYSSQRLVEGRRESARMFAQGGHTSGKVARLISGVLALLIGIIFSGGKVPQVLAATDLIVDGTTITLSGEHVFDQVRIINGGVLLVAPFNGVAGTGMLKLTAMSIVVDATSSIDADGRGFRGIPNESGEGPGGGGGGVSVLDGGGGGGYGGRGGRGVFDFAEELGPFDGQGGSAYGSPDTMAIDLGSAGGSAGTGDGDFGGVGGNGGGAIILEAETITIAGTLTARGQDGQIFVNDSSGGGAGGGIFLHGGMVTISGTIRASGGHGGTACGELPL
jgi:large repetitive protein